MENIWSFYESMPMLTRTYITACVLTTLGVQLDIISPFQLYFNYKLIVSHFQFWRIITNFLFFGTFSFTFMFNIIFTYRYCRMLEEGSFRSNSADFLFMLLFGAVLMLLVAPFIKLLFLSHAFTIMLVYIWAKRNTQIQLSLFGLLNFRAPHLPWILLGFSLLLGNSVLTDVLGIAVGHIYYYLEDVFPYLPGGFRILKTPSILVYLFDPAEYTLNRLNQEHLANQRAEERNQNLNGNLTGNSNESRDQTGSTNVNSTRNLNESSNENSNENSNANRTDNSTSQTSENNHESNTDQSNREQTLRNRSDNSSDNNQARYQEHDHLD